jgi:hypothetical protein
LPADHPAVTRDSAGDGERIASIADPDGNPVTLANERQPAT